MYRYKYREQLLSCTCIMHTRSIQTKITTWHLHLVPRVYMYNKEGGRSRVSYSSIYRALYSCCKRARSMTFTTCGVIVGSCILVVTHCACHAVGSCGECLMRTRSIHTKASAYRQYAKSAYQQSRMAAML